MNRRLKQNFETISVSLLWVFMCIVIFIGFEGDLNWIAVILFGLFCYSSYMLWGTVLTREIRPLELSFWLFHSNFLLLPALSQSLHTTFYWSPYNSYQPSELLSACFTIFLGLILFSIGKKYYMKRFHKKKRSAPEKNFLIQPIIATWSSQLFLVSILASLMVIVSRFGMAFFMSERMSKLSQVDSLMQVGLLLNLPRALALGVLLFSLALIVQRWHDKKWVSLHLLVIFIVALGLNSIINYPLSIARFWIFGFLISLVWIIQPLRSIMRRFFFVVGMTIMQFTIFPWYSQITRGKGWIGVDIASIRQYLHHGDFDGFQSIVNSLIYIQDSGFEFGKNIGSALFFFVPRAFLG